jgi:YVTN family beta-propeller protein
MAPRLTFGCAAIIAALHLPLAEIRAQTAEIAFVSNSADATVALLDVATRTIVGRIDVNPKRTKASGPGAANYLQDTDVSPDGRTLYASRGYLGDVAAFDLASGKLLWATPLNTGRADHMVLSRDGRHLFVSAMLDNRVYRIETASGRLMGHVVGGVYTHDNKISADGRLLFNTSIGALATMPRAASAPPLTEKPGGPFQVTIVDVATFEVRDRIRTDEAIRPWHFAPDGKGMYVQVANKHEVAFFDLAERRFTRRLALPVKPGITAADFDFEAPQHGLALSDDGRTLCLAGRASDYAALVSAPDLELIATIPAGDGPGWAEMADNGKLCLVTNTRSDDLSIISVAERKEISRLPIGDGPKHVTIARIPGSVVEAIKRVTIGVR